MKELNYYLSLHYPIALIYEDDGWAATHPDLFGTVGAGDTPQEALDDLEESRIAWLTYSYEEGMSIPEPSTELVPATAHRTL